MKHLLFSGSTICTLLVAMILIAGCRSTSDIGPRSLHLDTLPIARVSVDEIDIDTYLENYPVADGVYLNKELSYDYLHVPGETSGSTIYLRYARVLIGTSRTLVLDPNSESLGTRTIRVDSGESLQEVHVAIISPAGEVRRFDLADFRVDERSSGGKIYRLAYPGIERGSVIDEGFEIFAEIGVDRPFGSHPLQFSIPCERLDILYSVPRTWKIEHEITGVPEDLLAERFSKVYNPDIKRDLYRYTATDIPPSRSEPFAPRSADRLPFFHAALWRFESSGHSSTLGIRSWREYADGVRGAVFGEESVDIAPFRPLLDSIERAGSSDDEKMRSVLSWVWENIEVDVEGPRRVDEAFDERSGTLLTVSGLTELLLQQSGIASSLVMLRPASDGPPVSKFIMPLTYYVPAVEATLGDSTYLLFPYVRNYPIGQIPLDFQGGRYLNVSTSKRNKGLIKSLPYQPGSTERTETYFDVAIDEEGTMRVEETRTHFGDDGYSIRRMLQDLDSAEATEELWETIAFESGELRRVGLEIEDRDDYGRPLVINYRYEVDNLVTVTPDEIIVQTDGIFSPAGRSTWKIDTDDRIHPIVIYNDELLVKNVNITVPSSWELQTSPQDIERETRFGRVSATYIRKPGQFVAVHRRELKRGEGEADQFDDLMAIIGKGTRLSIESLVFSR